MKAKNCDQCKHAEFIRVKETEIYCHKLHRPRFYMPKHANDIDFGWKRRCNDFEVMK